MKSFILGLILVLGGSSYAETPALFALSGCEDADEMQEILDTCGATEVFSEELLTVMFTDICSFPTGQVFTDPSADKAVNQFRAFYLDVLNPEFAQLQGGDRKDLLGQYVLYTLDEQQSFACVFDAIRSNLENTEFADLTPREKVDFVLNQDYLKIFSAQITTDLGLGQLQADYFAGTTRYAPWTQFDGLGLFGPPFATILGAYPSLQFESKSDVEAWSRFLTRYRDSIDIALSEMQKGITLGYKGHLAQIDPAASLGADYAPYWNPADIFGFFWIDGPSGKLSSVGLNPTLFKYGGPLSYLGERENAGIDALVAAGTLKKGDASKLKAEHARIYDEIIKKMKGIDAFIKGPYTANARTSLDEVGMWATVPNQPEIGEAQFEALLARRGGIVIGDPVPCIEKVGSGDWTPDNETYSFFLDESVGTLVQKINRCGLEFVNWFNEQKAYWKDQYEAELLDALGAAGCVTLTGNNTCEFPTLEAVYDDLALRYSPKEGIDFLCVEHYVETSDGDPTCNPATDTLDFDNPIFGQEGPPSSDQQTLLYQTLKTNYEANFVRLVTPTSNFFSAQVIEGVNAKIPSIEFWGGSGASAAFRFDTETGALLVLFQTLDPTAPRLVPLDSTSVHELYLGHGFQLPLDLSTLEDPVNRATFSFARNVFIASFGVAGEVQPGIFGGANAEGWAAYTEILADEMGLYNKVSADGDSLTDEPLPASHLLSLANTSRIAARMVADTGINSTDNLSLELNNFFEAQEWFIDNTQLPLADSQEFVNRMVAIPGQSSTYGIGAMAILAFREKARALLGVDFDIKDFHDAALLDATGTSVNSLGQAIRNYVEAKCPTCEW